jgi:hypothetical protein
MTRAKASFSIYGYLSSAPLRTLLMKYTSFYSTPSSRIRAALTTVGEAARYKYNNSPKMALLNKGELTKYFFN